MSNKEHVAKCRAKAKKSGKVRYERTIWAELVGKMDAYLDRLLKAMNK